MTPPEFFAAVRGQQRLNGIDPDQTSKESANDDWRLPEARLREIMKGEI